MTNTTKKIEVPTNPAKSQPETYRHLKQLLDSMSEADLNRSILIEGDTGVIYSGGWSEITATRQGKHAAYPNGIVLGVK